MIVPLPLAHSFPQWNIQKRCLALTACGCCRLRQRDTGQGGAWHLTTRTPAIYPPGPKPWGVAAESASSVARGLHPRRTTGGLAATWPRRKRRRTS